MTRGLWMMGVENKGRKSRGAVLVDRWAKGIDWDSEIPHRI